MMRRKKRYIEKPYMVGYKKTEGFGFEYYSSKQQAEKRSKIFNKKRIWNKIYKKDASRKIKKRKQNSTMRIG